MKRPRAPCQEPELPTRLGPALPTLVLFSCDNGLGCGLELTVSPSPNISRILLTTHAGGGARPVGIRASSAYEWLASGIMRSTLPCAVHRVESNTRTPGSQQSVPSPSVACSFGVRAPEQHSIRASWATRSFDRKLVSGLPSTRHGIRYSTFGPTTTNRVKRVHLVRHRLSLLSHGRLALVCRRSCQADWKTTTSRGDVLFCSAASGRYRTVTLWVTRLQTATLRSISRRTEHAQQHVLHVLTREDCVGKGF